MKNTLHLPALSLADQAWLSQTLERNRNLFGGWSMEEPGGAGDSGGDAGDDGGTDTGASGDSGDQGGTDKGYPPNTPVAQMTADQQAAYWKDQAQRHEGRNKDLLRITGNKYGDALKADLDELTQLRSKNLTDAERAVEDAKSQTRAEVAKELGTDAARMAFEFALGHDPEKNDQSTLIETLDLTKVLNDDGKVDTAKVRAVVAKIAPTAKGKGNDVDYGAGRRTSSEKSGIAAGAALFEARSGKTKPNNT